MLAQVLESGETSRLRSLLIIAVLAAIVMTIVQSALAHAGVMGQQRASDFDAFYMAAQLVQRGDIAGAYDYPTYVRQQVELLSADQRLAWSYPPPYDLLVAPLALVPRGVAFALFFAISALAYVLVLWRLSGPRLVTMLQLLMLPVCMVVLFGQNGLLTGALLGLAVVGLRDRRDWAGVPLGLMIIKPHLALGLGLYVLIDRRWRVLAVAALTAGIAVLLPMLLIGPDIWRAFAAGIHNTASLLQGNFYPFRRMVSLYSALRSAGLPTGAALAGQAMMAVAALVAIVVAQRRLPATEALGSAALLSLAFSPYAYDYDVPVMAVGLAVLLPALRARGSAGERSALYGLFLVMALWGIGHSILYGPAITGRSPAGVLHIALLALAGTMLWRRSEGGNVAA